MSNPQPITVLVADDHAIVREGIVRLVDGDSRFTVVAEACNGQEAVALAESTKPDVCIVDLAMPILNGTEASRQILQQRPDVHIIILTAYADDAYFESLQAIGVVGFLAKHSSLDLLAKAILTVMRGGTWFSNPNGRHRHESNPPMIENSGLVWDSAAPLAAKQAEAKAREIAGTALNLRRRRANGRLGAST